MQYRKSDFCEHQIAFKFVNSTKVLWKVLKLQWVFSEGAEQSGIYSKKKLNTLGKRQNNTPRELKNCLCPYITKTLKAIMHGMLGQDHGLATAHFSVEKWVWPTRKSAKYSPFSVLKIFPLPQRHWRFTKLRVLGGLRLYETAATFTGTGGSQVLGKASDT